MKQNDLVSWERKSRIDEKGSTVKVKYALDVGVLSFRRQIDALPSAFHLNANVLTSRQSLS